MEEIRQLVESMTDEAGMVDAAALLEALAEMELSQKESWQDEKKEFLLREVFWKAGARDAAYLAYHYREDAVFDESGRLVNGEELAARAKEEYPEFFQRRQARLSGVKPQEGKSVLPGKEAFSGMGYAQRAELYAKDPELYRKLRGF
ncbi:MAG TPA: hypothetical protein IAB51_06990 [Candidatus Merdivicinus excrementipullorum]|uniref:Uncharacterized protein n=1 Tax=Candidatus Merdivicinus excrementipullorum TaxID=2840867 RepID=A0A9D1FN25_9FIRM|nr:hypothetical protein [Candidatus Merdivicinus excrementipullorum]